MTDSSSYFEIGKSMIYWAAEKLHFSRSWATPGNKDIFSFTWAILFLPRHHFLHRFHHQDDFQIFPQVPPALHCTDSFLQHRTLRSQLPSPCRTRHNLLGSTFLILPVDQIIYLSSHIAGSNYSKIVPPLQLKSLKQKSKRRSKKYRDITKYWSGNIDIFKNWFYMFMFYYNDCLF